MILGSFKGILTDIQLSAAEQDGLIKIISRPTIATMDNQAAKIRSGTKFYVNTNGNISIGGGGGATTNSVGSTLQEIDTGIELDVTPQISENNFIQLNISATQSEADFAKAINGIPAVNDNEAQTTVSLRDGETTIIGGLFKLRDAKTVKGIPGLMKVPLLGNLFKSTTKEKEKSELLIFITPKIIESAVSSIPSFQEPESIFNPERIAAEEARAARRQKPVVNRSSGKFNK
jgi:type IV pilus assembly protein PilQ